VPKNYTFSLILSPLQDRELITSSKALNPELEHTFGEVRHRETKSLIPFSRWPIGALLFCRTGSGARGMIRTYFTCFAAFLLLITWLDDIYLGGQTPDDPSDDCSFSENDTFLPSEAPEHCSNSDIKDRPNFTNTIRVNEARIGFLSGTPFLSFFLVPHRLTSLVYVFMSLQR